MQAKWGDLLNSRGIMLRFGASTLYLRSINDTYSHSAMHKLKLCNNNYNVTGSHFGGLQWTLSPLILRGASLCCRACGSLLTTLGHHFFLLNDIRTRRMPNSTEQTLSEMYPTNVSARRKIVLSPTPIPRLSFIIKVFGTSGDGLFNADK